MKTLTIERPIAIDRFTREILFHNPDFDLRQLSKEDLKIALEGSQMIGGGATAAANTLMLTQLLEGALMIVDVGVSRDLEVSSAVGSLEDLIWPSQVFEMRFGDSLPAVILYAKDRTSDTDEAAVAFACSDKSGAVLTLSLNETMWKAYCDGGVMPTMDKVIPEDLPMEDDEASAMKYMAMLAIKVIAYASVPQHRPVQLKTRSELKEAGIHPKHVTPNQKTLRVKYLPRKISDPMPKAGETGEGTHRFMGRAGHIRYFTSEFFKNVKGQWRWIAPIPPPEGIKVIYKVKKIS
jgi:hypothetical protein